MCFVRPVDTLPLRVTKDKNGVAMSPQAKHVTEAEVLLFRDTLWDAWPLHTEDNVELVQ